MAVAIVPHHLRVAAGGLAMAACLVKYLEYGKKAGLPLLSLHSIKRKKKARIQQSKERPHKLWQYWVHGHRRRQYRRLNTECERWSGPWTARPSPPNEHVMHTITKCELRYLYYLLWMNSFVYLMCNPMVHLKGLSTHACDNVPKNYVAPTPTHTPSLCLLKRLSEEATSFQHRPRFNWGI